MPTALILAAAVLFGQTEQPPPPPSATSRVFEAPAPHVGKGHFTLGTSGSIGYQTGTSTFNFFSSVSGAYFFHDRILIGASVGLNVSSYTGPVPPGTTTASASIPVGAFGQYWHPLVPRVYLLAGLSLGVVPAFGATTSAGWSLTPHLGVALFLTDWLALEPRVSVALSGGGAVQANVNLSWGMVYFL